MVIGILQIELDIAWAQSLKDKRSVVKSLKDRLHREHMVSVAEVATLESHQTATLGIVLATNEVARAQSVLDSILEKVKTERNCVLSDHAMEILTGM